METLFAVLHVTAAVFLIGPLALLPMTGLRAIRTGTASQVASVARSTRLIAWLSLIVAVLGFALVAFVDPEDQLTPATPWLATSIGLYAAAVTIVLSGVAPLLARAALDVASSAEPRRYGMIAGLSGLSTLMLVAVVVLMVWRP